MHYILLQFSFLGDPFGHHCIQCDMKLPNAVSLRNHVYHEHDDHEPRVCPICGSTFKNPYRLIQHKNTAHFHPSYNSNYRLFCHICEAGFNEDSKLDEHMALHNLPSMSLLTCVYCRLSKLLIFVR